MGTAQVAFVVVVLPEVIVYACSTGSDVITRSDRMRNHFPRFVLTIVVSLRMTDRATGSGPNGVLLGVHMRSRKLRKISPSGAF